MQCPRFCEQEQKGGTGVGGWVHPGGTNQQNVCLGLALHEWTILSSTNWLCSAAIMAVNVFFSISDGTGRYWPRAVTIIITCLHA